MMEFEVAYENAVKSGHLPGVALLAGNDAGEIIYSKSLGKKSLREGNEGPFQMNTVCAVASCTKLMTAVAVLQCVEDGVLELDKPVSYLLPEVGSYGIMTGWDDSANRAITSPNNTPITLRMLLTNTSGHEYDWLSPLLIKWRMSRSELPWTGATVEQKSTLPLVFEPGTGFAYGAGSDWAGKMIERATGETLEAFMSRKIWAPLGIKDATFFPKKNASIQSRLADISTLMKGQLGTEDITSVKDEHESAVDDPNFDILFGGTECLGGGGLFASPEGYFSFLQAVLRRDSRVLKPNSWEELFKPQLDEKCEQAFNDYLKSSPAHT